MKESIDFSRAPAMEIGQEDRHSVVEIPEEVIFRFEKGIPAFEKATEFVFLLEQKIAFQVIQLLRPKNLSLVIPNSLCWAMQCFFQVGGEDPSQEDL